MVEFRLDVPFPANKVTNAVRKLKKRKDPRPDGLLAEHLKAGAEAVNIWLRNILNAVVELEVISEVLHELRGVLLSLHTKLVGCFDSYLGITLTSMVVKVLEYLLLDWLESIFVDAGLSHINYSDSVQNGSLMCRSNVCHTGGYFQVVEGWNQCVYVPVQSAEGF